MGPLVGKCLAVIIKDVEVLSVGTDYEKVTLDAFYKLNEGVHLSIVKFQEELNEFRSSMKTGINVESDQLTIIELTKQLSTARKLLKTNNYLELVYLAVDNLHKAS